MALAMAHAAAPWDDTRSETQMPDMVSLAWEMSQNFGSGPDISMHGAIP